MEPLSNGIYYCIGLATPFAFMGATYFLSWAFARGTGQNGCYVCDHGPHGEIGEKTNIRMWLEGKWHRYFWAKRKWHREAWANHPINQRRSRA